VAYWLQLKPAFDHFGLPFPVLLPRNFALIVSGMLAAKLDRFGLQPTDLFGGFKAAKDKLLDAAGKEDVQLTGEMEELRRLFGSILQKAKSVDPSLAGFIGAEQARTEKILENIEKRLNKAEEQKQETGIRQLEGIANRLFRTGNCRSAPTIFSTSTSTIPRSSGPCSTVSIPSTSGSISLPAMSKDELRRLYLDRRMALRQDEMADYNRAIHRRIFSLLGRHDFQYAHIFLPWCRNTKSIPGR
jgi:hypothetical protein